MIKLNYLEKEDLSKIVEWNANKSADFLLQWAGPAYSYPLTLKQVEDYYLNNVTMNNSRIYLYKIILMETNEMIGSLELRENEADNKSALVCRFLIGEENLRGKGIGADVLKEVLRIGFEDFKFEKVGLRVFDFNHSAIKCYENVGFVKEKLIENARKATTGYWSLYEMSISKQAYFSGKK